MADITVRLPNGATAAVETLARRLDDFPRRALGSLIYCGPPPAKKD